MGWDAFGLPAENDAIKMGVHPRVTTERNIANYQRQMDLVGLSFDWSREVTSCIPDYYRWTQWFFLLLYERGLAYQATGQRGGARAARRSWPTSRWRTAAAGAAAATVTKKDLEQWYFRITDYAERLLDDLETIDWPEKIKLMQANWIGRSEGAEVDFALQGRDDTLTVFTTRPDTLFGVTYMVLAPEHPLVDELDDAGAARRRGRPTRTQARRQSEIERLQHREGEDRRLHRRLRRQPGERRARSPIWIADYVLMGYGTGAIMAVPAHDERDFAVRDPVRRSRSSRSIAPPERRRRARWRRPTRATASWSTPGRFDGLAAPGEAFEAIVALARRARRGRKTVNFKLRDWLISRQRYWGAPIPIVHCEQCGAVAGAGGPAAGAAAGDRGLPAHGRRPVAAGPRRGFVNTTCPRCGGPGAARDRHHGHLRLLQLVLLPLRRPARRRRPRSTETASTTGCRSTCTSAAPSTPSCTCSTRASSARWRTTPATSASASPSPRCATRA